MLRPPPPALPTASFVQEWTKANADLLAPEACDIFPGQLGGRALLASPLPPRACRGGVLEACVVDNDGMRTPQHLALQKQNPRKFRRVIFFGSLVPVTQKLSPPFSFFLKYFPSSFFFLSSFPSQKRLQMCICQNIISFMLHYLFPCDVNSPG